MHKPQPVATLILRPFQTFARREASGGIMLFAFTVLALAWANSPWAQAYTDLWATGITVGFGEAALSKPLPNVPADYANRLVKNDFAWAAKNRDRILAEWSKRYESKAAPK